MINWNVDFNAELNHGNEVSLWVFTEEGPRLFSANMALALQVADLYVHTNCHPKKPKRKSPKQ